MLQRMTELAVKAANGTQTSDDLSYIDSEVQALKSEISRVATTTTFNEQSLLDGTFTGKALQVGAENNAEQRITIDISAYPTDEGGESDVSCQQYMGDEGCC